LIGVVAAAPLLVDKWINLTSISRDTATTMVRFLAITTLIMLPRALYSSLFQGRQRMELNNGIDVGSSAVQQLGIIVILATGGDTFAVVKWIALAAVLSTVTYMIIVARLFGARMLVPTFSADVIRRNARFTAHMGALTVLNMVLVQFDKVVVSKLLPIATVGYYSFASNVVIRLSFAVSAVGQAALPSFSHLYQKRDTDALLTQYRKLQDLICYGMVPLFAAVTFGALPLYGYLFDRQVAWLLLLPTALLCLGFYLAATVHIPYTFSVAIGMPYIASRSNALALVVLVPVTTALVYFYGLPGAACSWIVLQICLYVYMIPRICRECLHISAVGWYAHVARPLALAGITYGLVWIAVVVPQSYSESALALVYSGASAAFIFGALALIGPDLRSTLWRLPRRLLART
jgi:O-antigen/teichoic acid export membrane protein